jgi:hypothetical protein
MSTRSTIAIQNKDNTVTGVYCHSDGYVSGVGRTLFENYTHEDSVRELIALGSLSILGTEIGSKHNFNNNDNRSWCKAYGRDRGESDQEANTWDSYQQLINESRQDYNYLFTPGQGWTATRYVQDTTDVADLLDAAPQEY